jgi:hypothetical protein
MATWLKVNGFVCCILSVTLLTLSLILYFLPKSTLFFGFLMTLVFDSCFRVTWGIVGGVMYFGFLLPRSDCTEGVEGYLLVTVLGEFGLVVGHCLATRVRGEGEVMVEETEVEERER